MLFSPGGLCGLGSVCVAVRLSSAKEQGFGACGVAARNLEPQRKNGKMARLSGTAIYLFSARGFCFIITNNKSLHKGRGPGRSPGEFFAFSFWQRANR